MKIVARWESKGGKHFVELERFESGYYGYRASNGGGMLGTSQEKVAMLYLTKKVEQGLFQPDAAKTPMRRVR